MMKRSITTMLLSAFTLLAFSQNNMVVNTENLSFDIVGPRYTSIKKENLIAASTLTDINKGFPSNWIRDYNSVTITTLIDGEKKLAVGTNDFLNTDQRKLLAQAQLENDIIVNVKYNIVNAANNEMHEETMEFKLSVVPETQAEFPGGHEAQKKFMLDNGIDLLRSKKMNSNATIKFTIDENGALHNPNISSSSGQAEHDKILMDLLLKMPKWTPARNSQNNNVKQNFQLVIANQGC